MVERSNSNPEVLGSNLSHLSAKITQKANASYSLILKAGNPPQRHAMFNLISDLEGFDLIDLNKFINVFFMFIYINIKERHGIHDKNATNYSGQHI